VEVRVAATLESLAVLRAIVGAVATFEDLDFDAVADLRLAVDEACTRLIQSANEDSPLVLIVESHQHEVVVKASTVCDRSDVLVPGSFSWHVLAALTDEVKTFVIKPQSQDELAFGISLTTRRMVRDG